MNGSVKVIVIAGRARSGKNTVCRMLKKMCERDGLKVVISPYTKYLKMYIETITGKHYDDSSKPRELLQKLGVEVIKKELGRDDLLISRQLDDILVYSKFFDVIIIPDARFPKEIEVIREYFKDSISIKVVTTRKNNLTKSENEHITETSMDNYNDVDYVVNNDNLSNLEVMVRKIYEKI